MQLKEQTMTLSIGGRDRHLKQEKSQDKRAERLSSNRAKQSSYLPLAQLPRQQKTSTSFLSESTTRRSSPPPEKR